MRKYEYKRVSFNEHETEKILNSLGERGFKVIHLEEVHSVMGSGFNAILMRRKKR